MGLYALHFTGDFLIPYFVMFFLIGLPMIILETALGQYCSLGPIKCWKAMHSLPEDTYTSPIARSKISPSID